MNPHPRSREYERDDLGTEHPMTTPVPPESPQPGDPGPPQEPLGPVELPEPDVVDIPEPDVVEVPERRV